MKTKKKVFIAITVFLYTFVIVCLFEFLDGVIEKIGAILCGIIIARLHICCINKIYDKKTENCKEDATQQSKWGRYYKYWYFALFLLVVIFAVLERMYNVWIVRIVSCLFEALAIFCIIERPHRTHNRMEDGLREL